MQIPVSKQAVESDSPDFPSLLKPLPSLPAVQINASRHRLILYRCSYLLFTLSVLSAFYPFVREQYVWAFGVIVTSGGLWAMYRREMAKDLAGSLSFVGNQWVFDQASGRYQLELAGEVVCWPWIIILPFRATNGRKSRRLLIFNDALSKADNVRLRAWLRASLVPKA